jgi:hypothetical protein
VQKIAGKRRVRGRRGKGNTKQKAHVDIAQKGDSSKEMRIGHINIEGALRKKRIEIILLLETEKLMYCI